MRAVRYCCTVAWIMFGGKQFLGRSIKVSAVEMFSGILDFSVPTAVTSSPGLMASTSPMPRMTASKVVDR